MPKYLIKVNIEKEIEAIDDQDAILKYLQDIEEDYNNSLECELTNNIEVVPKN